MSSWHGRGEGDFDPYTRDQLLTRFLRHSRFRGGVIGPKGDEPPTRVTLGPGPGEATIYDKDGEVALTGVEVVRMSVRFPTWEEEELLRVGGRPSLKPRLLYWLADRTGRARVRRKGWELDERLAPERERRSRREVMPVSWQRTYEGSITVRSADGDWARNIWAWLMGRDLEVAYDQLRVENDRQPWTRGWWRAVWRVMREEFKAGVREATR